MLCEVIRHMAWVDAKFQRHSQSWNLAFSQWTTLDRLIIARRNSAHQRQKLRVIRQVFDEWLTRWPTVFRIVT
jgi:hypothetical protein